MDEKLGIGIVGCGVVSASHIDSYLEIPDVEIRAFCDLLPKRLKATTEKYADVGARELTDYKEMLADPEIHALSICTGHATHEAIAIDALQAGKHVLCEKALTINNESLDRMLAAAAETNCVAAGIFQHRFDQIYRSLREIIQSGQLGQLLTISLQHQCLRPAGYYTQDAWRGSWAEEGGSLLINQSIHFLDLLQWMTGGVASVTAFISNLAHVGVIETEDCATASMVLQNGALASFTATSGSNREWNSAFQIIGTKGHICIDDGKLVSLSHTDEEQEKLIQTKLTGVKELDGVEGAKSYYGPSHPAQVHDFVKAIQDKREPYVGFNSAGDTVRLVLAIYESARTNKPVALQGL